VDTDTMLVVATGLTQAANDKQQIAPRVETLCALPEELGEVSELLTDAGYYSEANVATCVEAGIEPLIATGRESHHLPWQERFSEPPLLCEPADGALYGRAPHRDRERSGQCSLAVLGSFALNLGVKPGPCRPSSGNTGALDLFYDYWA
ncbi:MAG: hypothetical protein ACREWE_11075, partial [Gammaproteobacteria bacterium]